MSRTFSGLCSLPLAVAVACVGICDEPIDPPRSISAKRHLSDGTPDAQPDAFATEPVLTAADNFPKRSCEACEHARAGCPQSLRPLVRPTNNCRYFGYYVGGGLPVRGEPRYLFHDGTWGWDYGGILFNKQVDLNWSHGSRAQGGTGAYKTDDPKLLGK